MQREKTKVWGTTKKDQVKGHSPGVGAARYTLTQASLHPTPRPQPSKSSMYPPIKAAPLLHWRLSWSRRPGAVRLPLLVCHNFLM